MAQNKHVVIYTDGACSGNPGPGGFGIILQYGEHRKEISKGFPNTTNNRMELLGVITAIVILVLRVTLDPMKRHIMNFQQVEQPFPQIRIFGRLFGCAHPIL